MPMSYPSDFKKKVIRRYQQGESLTLLSQEYHVALSTLYHWRKEYRAIQTPQRTFTPKEFDSMARRLQKLEHEMEIIQNTGYIERIPLQEKLAALEQLYNLPNNPYSVYELCEALNVARGTFYNHIFRRVDRTKFQDEQAQLVLKVKQIFDDNEQRFGAEKIRIILKENGICVSRKRITAIMQEYDLHSVRTDAKKLYKNQQRQKKQNLLERSFTASHPNQIWVSDITYFKINNYWVYLCIILDLYARKVVGYGISRNMSTRLVTATFERAFKGRNQPNGLTFHSDRGRQYCSNTFSALLQKHGIKQSFSASGRPIDNAGAEAFFSSFKREEAYRRDYTSEKHFRRCTEEYIRFYNEVRPHQTLHYKTPLAYEEQYENRFVEKLCSNHANP